MAQSVNGGSSRGVAAACADEIEERQLPDRIIHEEARRSESLARLSAEAERLHWRLITAADDFGRFLADARAVRADCFAFHPDVTDEDCARWLSELSSEGVIQVYEVAGKRYGQFAAWSRYQRTRAGRSKFPEPNSADICQQVPANDGELRASADIRGHLRTSAAVNVNVNEIRERERERESSNPVLGTSLPARARRGTETDKPRVTHAKPQELPVGDKLAAMISGRSPPVITSP